MVSFPANFVLAPSASGSSPAAMAKSVNASFRMNSFLDRNVATGKEGRIDESSPAPRARARAKHVSQSLLSTPSCPPYPRKGFAYPRSR
jgi:hypothetical protein